MLVLLGPFLQGIKWFVIEFGGKSPFTSKGDIPLAISIFHTAFNVTNTLLLVGLIHPLSRAITRVLPKQEPLEKEIEEPKFLTDQAMAYPQTAIAAVEQETRYLFEHAIFEILAHALHLHRKDIFSEEDPDHVVRISRADMKTNVRELYLTKVKRIYSLIIAYATRAQSRLHLMEEQHRRISELKQANRLMVEVLRNAADLNRNVSRYLDDSSEVMSTRYDLFRGRMVWALRSIARCGVEENSLKRQSLFEELASWVKIQAEADNRDIDGLIRDEAISPEMATSLLNDSDNIVEIIKNLIIIAKLLYDRNNV
jgi:phosphate:Na+ symporter